MLLFGVNKSANKDCALTERDTAMSFPPRGPLESFSAGHCGFASLNTFAPYRRPTADTEPFLGGEEKHWRVVPLIEAANPSSANFAAAAAV